MNKNNVINTLDNAIQELTGLKQELITGFQEVEQSSKEIIDFIETIADKLSKPE